MVKWLSGLFDTSDKEITRVRRIVAEANDEIVILLERERDFVAGIREVLAARRTEAAVTPEILRRTMRHQPFDRGIDGARLLFQAYPTGDLRAVTSPVYVADRDGAHRPTIATYPGLIQMPWGWKKVFAPEDVATVLGELPVHHAAVTATQQAGGVEFSVFFEATMDGKVPLAR